MKGSEHVHILHTALKTYPSRPDIAVFTQQLPNGATNTNTSNPQLPSGIRELDPGNYPPIIAFPSLSGGKLNELAYVTWQSRMINVEFGTSITNGSAGTNEPLLTGRGLQGLSTNGPAVLFDRDFNALVIAPMNNFKSAIHYSRANTSVPTWDTGVSSELVSLPKGFEHSTMVVAGRGITAVMEKFGRALRVVHSTNRTGIERRDRNIEYLSYWTDNGAYMSGGAWERPEGGNGGGTVVNEAGFKAVARGLESQGLLDGVKSWQLDDWWYHTSKPQGGPYSACVANWSLHKRTFPSGLKNLSRDLGIPWILYVPFWCPENEHSNSFRWLHSHQNKSNTILTFAEPHPDDSLRFYRMLFDYGMAQGMSGFEHDYLDYNFLSMPYLRKTYGAANKWLAGINKAALERNLPVQFCMALPSDLMATVQFDAVTNYRASTDYGIDDSSLPIFPHDANLNIGASSLLGFALGVRPSKDIFWTHRPENCRGDPQKNPHACGRWGAHTNQGSNCELNALVATLSTGPVSIADKAGTTNKTLVQRCVRADGRILQPDKPVTSVDSMFAQAFTANNNRFGGYSGSKSRVRTTPQPHNVPNKLGAQVWATTVSIEDRVWHYVLSIDVGIPWHIHGNDFWPNIPDSACDTMQLSATLSSGWVAHSWFTGHRPTACVNGTYALSSGCIVAKVSSAEDIPPFHNKRPIMVANDTHQFDLLELAPIGPNGWVLLGEVGRYVRVSRDRFDGVLFSSGGIVVKMSGSKGEAVELTALQPLAVDDSAQVEWVVHVRNLTFGESGRATIVFH